MTSVSSPLSFLPCLQVHFSEEFTYAYFTFKSLKELENVLILLAYGHNVQVVQWVSLMGRNSLSSVVQSCPRPSQNTFYQAYEVSILVNISC